MWVTRETSCLWWYLSVSYKTAVTVLLSRLVCFVCFQIATVMTPLSWLNKANLSVCPSVFSSMKSFFSDLNVIWYLGVGLWLLDDGMPYENSKVKVTEAQKLKNGRFLSVSSTSMHVIKRLTVNYRTPRQYLDFAETDLWDSSSFSVTWPVKFGYYEELTGRPVWACFLILRLLQGSVATRGVMGALMFSGCKPVKAHCVNCRWTELHQRSSKPGDFKHHRFCTGTVSAVCLLWLSQCFDAVDLMIWMDRHL